MRAAIRQVLFGETPFSPRQLFANGENGAWYEPRDSASMLQLSSGTTPVTAAEQPVGLLLDKRLNGIGANGAARYNLLAWSEDMTNAAWSKPNASISATKVLDPFGGTNGNQLFENTSNTGHYVRQSLTVASGTTFIYSVYVKPNGRDWCLIQIGAGSDYVFAFFNVATGTSGNTAQAGATISASAPVAAANGYYYLRIAATFNAAKTSVFCDVFTATANGTSSYVGNTGLGIIVSHADFRVTANVNAIPVYQPITSTWAATIPGNHAAQSTLTSRPTLKADPTYLDFDADPDQLTVTFATSPGVCTVACKDPNDQPNLTTGVNISGTTYNLNTSAGTFSFSGYVIINRALTSAETAKLTAYLARLP